MNRVQWKASRIDVEPVCVVDCETGKCRYPVDQFAIRMLMGTTSREVALQTFVHIPKELQPYFNQNMVTEFTLETLQRNRLASDLLPGEPNALICAVITESGEKIRVMPAVLRRARRGLKLAAWGFGALAATGLFVVPTIVPIISALSLAGSVLAMRVASDIPAE